MTEYYNNILCIQAGWLINQASILSKSNYDALKRRGLLNVIRPGGNGRTALVEFESMRSDIKAQVKEMIGDPYKKVKLNRFEEALQPDPEAAHYFSTFKLPDGRNLPDDKQREYLANAEILNALHEMVKTRTAKRRALGGSTGKVWDRMADLVNQLDTNRYQHNLPSNPRRLQMRYKKYRKDGYLSLVSKKFCNDNSRKVTADLERLILSLYVMPNKPYSKDVHEMYLQFLGRAIEVYDYKTGELFEPDNFRNEKGEPIRVSEATIWNYLNMPENEPVLKKFRAGQLEYKSTARPHHHRHAPNYSLSKISMDDRDLPRKMPDGKRVKAYYAYDVMSGAIIGASYSKKKDTSLFIECMRDMFRNLNEMGLGIPMQPEVEHHLVSSYKDDLMKAEVVFPFIHWANPGNAQEKHAESFHRIKKYKYEKKYQDGIGRFYAKLEANRTAQDKIFDEDNDNYKERTLDFENLVADDREIIDLYNNDLHPNQKRFPGKSRLEVLINYPNPNCAHFEEYKVARYIGDRTDTSIQRNQYLHVKLGKYQLPSIDVLKRLKTNNYKVQAYSIPESTGVINRVYLYQGDEYICTCEKITTYNTANAEWTDADQQSYTNQAKYVSEFDAKVKARKDELAKVKVNRNPQPEPEFDDADLVVVEAQQEVTDDFTEYLNSYDPDEYRKRAQDQL